MLNTLRSTIKNTLIYSIGNVSSKLVGFILIPLYTSKLLVSEYGTLGILEITSQILIALFGLSLYNAFFRWYWDKETISKQKSIFFTILIVVALFSLFLMFLLSVFRQNISVLLFENMDYPYILMLMIIVSCLETLGVIIFTLIRLQEKASFFSFLSVLKISTSLIFTVYFIAFMGKKIEGIYEAQLIGNGVFFLFSFKYVLKNIKPKFELRILREMLSFSTPLIVTSLAGIILTVTDRYMLRFLVDLKAVGIYSLGFKVANTLRVFIISSVMMALQPTIYKMMNSSDNKRFYSKSMTYFSFGLMICVLGLSFFSKEIVKTLAFNVNYWEAFTIVPLLAFSMFFGMLRDVSLTGINLTKKTRITARVIISVAIINLVLNRLTIPVWGYYGAAFSTIIAQFLFFILIYHYAQKHYFIPYEIKKVIQILIVGIILIVISQLVNPMNIVYRLIIKSVLLLLFPIILYWLKFYEEIELLRIKQIWITWRNPIDWKKNIVRLKKNKLILHKNHRDEANL